MRHTIILAALLAAGCQTGRKPEAPPPAPIVAPAVDTAPAVDAVKRTVARTEAKVGDLEAKVVEANDATRAALEAAIRKNDAEQEAVLRTLAKQMEEIRLKADRAKQEADVLRSDVAAMDEIARRAIEERNKALEERESLRLRMEAQRLDAERRIAEADGTIAEIREARGRWAARALWTWGILGALVAGFVALKFWKPL